MVLFAQVFRSVARIYTHNCAGSLSNHLLLPPILCLTSQHQIGTGGLLPDRYASVESCSLFTVCVCGQELEGVSEANRQSLATLDSAMFVLCLDDEEVANESTATHSLLHNYGANRSAAPSACNVAVTSVYPLSADGLTSHSI